MPATTLPAQCTCVAIGDEHAGRHTVSLACVGAILFTPVPAFLGDDTVDTALTRLHEIESAKYDADVARNRDAYLDALIDVAILLLSRPAIPYWGGIECSHPDLEDGWCSRCGFDSKWATRA